MNEKREKHALHTHLMNIFQFEKEMIIVIIVNKITGFPLFTLPNSKANLFFYY